MARFEHLPDEIDRPDLAGSDMPLIQSCGLGSKTFSVPIDASKARSQKRISLPARKEGEQILAVLSRGSSLEWCPIIRMGHHTYQVVSPYLGYLETI